MTSTRHPQVNIPNTEVRSIISEFVGDTFKLFVALLNHDAQSKKRYPVLYILNANLHFGLVTETVQTLQFG